MSTAGQLQSLAQTVEWWLPQSLREVGGQVLRLLDVIDAALERVVARLGREFPAYTFSADDMRVCIAHGAHWAFVGVNGKVVHSNFDPPAPLMARVRALMVQPIHQTLARPRDTTAATAQ